MIVLTGATGSLGSSVLRHVLAELPADRIGVSVREPERAADLATQGVRVRRGDYAEPDSLRNAFEGADTVFLVSSNSRGVDVVDQHRAAIDAARDAGVRRIVYTAQQAAAVDSLFGPAVDHARTIEALADSGLAYTALRNGFYASSLVWLLGDAVRTGVVAAPEDGPVTWTANDDLAAADAALLLHPEDDPTPLLVGDRAWTLAEVAAELSELAGREIRRETLSEDDFRSRLGAAGVPEGIIVMQLRTYQAMRNGEFDVSDPTLGRLIDRPPAGIADTLRSLVSS